MSTASTVVVATPMAVARLLLILACGLITVADCQDYTDFINSYWTKDDCPWGHLETTLQPDLQACKEKCDDTIFCNRLNFGTAMLETCELFHCFAWTPSGRSPFITASRKEEPTKPTGSVTTDNKNKLVCTAFNGTCQLKTDFCPGELKEGHRWCKSPQRFGCCIPPKGNVCELQAVRGRGRDLLPRFYYNVDSEQCIRFIWGGRGGNANNFRTWEECTRICGHRPYESSLAEIEPSNTFIVKNPKRCNDNYNEWVFQLDAKSYSLAGQACRQKTMDLACPFDENAFILWLRERSDSKDFWLAGEQGQGDKFNYYYWANGYQVSRLLRQGNLWNDTNPLYPNEYQGCVKGNNLLSIEDCTKPLYFFCSKKY